MGRRLSKNAGYGDRLSRDCSSLTTALCPPRRPCQRRPSTVIFGVRVDSVLREQLLTTASCPILTAHDSGVCPLPPLKFRSTPSFASNCCTTASYPILTAAYDSGVCPLLSLESGLTPSFASNSLHHRLVPVLATHDSGVCPLYPWRPGRLRPLRAAADHRLVPIPCRP